MLFAMMACILHGSYPRISQIDFGILGLIWISAHSTTLQDFMAKESACVLNQLRIQGLKIEDCLLNLKIGSNKHYGDEDSNIKFSSTMHTLNLNWKQYIAKG